MAFLVVEKMALATVSFLTIAVYAAGLVLPICTQRAVDIIAGGAWCSIKPSWSGSGRM
jgi:hypothetical protein